MTLAPGHSCFCEYESLSLGVNWAQWLASEAQNATSEEWHSGDQVIKTLASILSPSIVLSLALSE